MRKMSERFFLSILTRAVDDSGWMEEISGPLGLKKSPVFVEIMI